MFDSFWHEKLKGVSHLCKKLSDKFVDLEVGVREKNI